jgi:mycothiol synthase
VTTRSRAYGGEEDYQRMRDLLVENYRLDRMIYNWGLGRLDWWRYRFAAGRAGWQADVRLWEDGADKLVGAVHPEAGSEAILDVHREYRHLEDEMYAWAEEHWRAARPAGAEARKVWATAFAGDEVRKAVLLRRGYTRATEYDYYRVRWLGEPLPRLGAPDGYGVRSVGGDNDLEQRVAVHNSAFEQWPYTVEVHRGLQEAPTYRPDLDLVAIAPDGTFAAFCIAWYDEHNRNANIEPVGTHVEFRRLGLAKAVVCEAMRRVKDLGGVSVYLGAGEGPEKGLYDALGFSAGVREYYWGKEL